MKPKLALLLGIGICSSACSTTALREEIAAIETRVAAIETGIDEHTADIAGDERSLNTNVRYRPVLAWADAFSARPSEERQISFQQTSRDGDLHRVSHRCRVTPWNSEYRAGERAWVHEARSTRATVQIERFLVTPQQDGLQFAIPLTFDARTQVAGNYRPPCQGGSAGGNVGVTGHARPNAMFRLRFADGGEGHLSYTLDLVLPETIGIEMRVHLPWFRIGFTVPMQNLTRQLLSGQVSMLHGTEGVLEMPDGQRIPYRLATVNPAVATTESGFSFATDLEIVIGR